MSVEIEVKQTPKEWFLSEVRKIGGCKNEDLVMNYFSRLNHEMPLMKTPKTWQSIDYKSFVMDSISLTNRGLDPFMPKTMYFIPRGNKISIELRFEAIEAQARNYGINCPENIICEILYENDKFAPVKKDVANNKESYVFEVPKPFDRGAIIGAFTFSQYKNDSFNKLLFYNLEQLKKITSESSLKEKWPEKMYAKAVLKQAWNRVVVDFTNIIQPVALTEFEPEDLQDLPFNPDAEV